MRFDILRAESVTLITRLSDRQPLLPQFSTKGACGVNGDVAFCVFN